MHDEFFSFVGDDNPADDRRYEAILLDIDHSPDSVLDPNHAAFYTPAGLQRMAAHLRPPGLFALWSADRLGEAFIEPLQSVFARVDVQAVRFFNPHLGEHDTNWIVIASAA